MGYLNTSLGITHIRTTAINLKIWNFAFLFETCQQTHSLWSHVPKFPLSSCLTYAEYRIWINFPYLLIVGSTFKTGSAMSLTVSKSEYTHPINF
jgi:hypothetical protein